MLKARALEKTYRVGERLVSALRPVDLDVASGHFVTILGRSGSGKSTLLTLLGGLASPSAGDVLLADQAIGRLSAAERSAKIGYMFQFSGLLPTLTALENSVLPARLAGKDKHDQAVEWLNQLGLGERLWALPSELSGGEQRRVAAVRAVINEPDLVLADEPTGDLDPASERQVIEFLRRHARTLILVTHNAELGRGSDQLFRMENGRLEAIQALEARPQATETDAATAEGPPVEFSTPEASDQERPSQAPGGRLIFALALLLAIFLVADLATSYRQKKILQTRREARKTLERAAMFSLRADVAGVERGPDGTYKVRIFLENPFKDKPLYIMTPEVSAYIQVGFNWVEVPLQPPPDTGVIKLAGRELLEYILSPQVASFEQVLPGYMHIRFTDVMRVSLSEHPGPDGVARRSDNYFIYLMPASADPVALGKKNNFRGKAPLWIPMPPH